MASNFPATIDVFTNPGGNDYLDDAAVPHSDQHANANDAIEALQAKVGIDNSEDPTSIDYILAHKVDQEAGKGLSSNDYTDTEKAKLAGIEAGANAYTHPTQHAPSIIAQDASNRFVTDDEKSAWSGKADLVGGKVPSAQLPSYVDDVIEATDFASLPSTGESGKIYVALDNNKTYRWSGSAYVEISPSPDLSGFATKTGVETLTNKTLTTPTVNGGTIDGATVGANTPAPMTVTTLMQKNRIDANWTIPNGINAVTIGPFEVNPDVTVTGLGNSTWRGL